AGARQRACASLHHFVRTQQDVARNRDTEGMGSLHIDDELEFRRLLDRQVARLHTFQYLVDVGGGSPVEIWVIDAVRDQASGIDELTRGVHGGQFVARGEVDDVGLISEDESFDAAQ